MSFHESSRSAFSGAGPADVGACSFGMTGLPWLRLPLASRRYCCRADRDRNQPHCTAKRGSSFANALYTLRGRSGCAIVR